MKTPPNPRISKRRRMAVALVTVLSVLSLTMILITAMLSVTRVEHKATVSQVEGNKARVQADSVINLVIGQIQNVSRQDTGTTGREIWTSQPGMVRQYQQDGTLLKGAKLYSDSKMVATTEAEIINDVPPADWDKKPAQYVDLNEPVVRADLNDPAGKPRVSFPIIDPRAYSTNPNKSVEAFSYSQYANGVSGQSLDGVVLPTGGDDVAQRLPMPVEWLYMLKDGTLGVVDEQGKFTSADKNVATRDNPIVARVAFWTDDESTKININTAGEGTFWSTPRLYHDRDGEWARFQPMGYEYQRYPGHPATVCMSTVLFPNQQMNPLVTDQAAFSKALKFKEAIYDLMPKILPGGSKAGSVLVPVGRQNYTPTDFKNVQTALAERLFPSSDEFLLRAGAQDNGERQEINLGVGQLWADLDTPEIVERLRPFLTPRSRAPELNPFGLPKISMWPVNRNTTPQYRTVYDNTIANVSTLAGREYFFTRMDNTSKAELSTGRNSQLFNYLMALTDQPIPGFGEANATFAQKYGDNRQQILVEMFDYIRSTNLYDDSLAEDNVGQTPAVTGLPDARMNSKLKVGYNAKTFTPMRDTVGNTYPGHGEVVPTVLAKGKGDYYRGMGRFLTISEVGLHFIACAEASRMDETETAGGMAAQKIKASSFPEVPYTAPTWRGGVWKESDYWYSNFPPLTGANQDPANGFYKTRYPLGHKLEGIDGDQPNHPGYNPANWNWTLDQDTPLPQGKKRVQATFLLEWFSPSAGWTIHNPNIALRIDASQLTVNGRKMFPAANPKNIIRPFKHMSNANGVYQRGGTVSYRAFLQERKLPAIAKGVNGCSAGSILFPDTNIPSNDTQIPYSGGTNYASYASRNDELKECNQYNLVSDFFDIDATGTIPFGGGKVTVQILTNETSPDILQTFEFDFPAAGFPAPQLMLKSEDTTRGTNADGTYYVNQPVPAPYWWSFHSDGALGRDKNGKITTDAAIPKSRMGGRFRYIGNEIGNYTSTSRYYRGSLALPVDTIQSLVLRHGDPRLTMGQYNVPSSEFQQHRLYGQQPMAHNIVFRNWSEGPGLDRGEDKKGWRLVKDATYNAGYIPDHPYTAACGAGLQKYGDFDRGVTNQTDGAYINKPDEGNTYSAYNTTTGEQLVPYFSESWKDYQGGPTYFSPNRQISSPGMFGSLPTGVLEGGGGPASRREPWRTLLFRPQQVRNNAIGLQAHVGAAKMLKGWGNGGRGLNVQGIDPPDHLFMDFFWMPVVEPYAISAPGSTAGKINLNYQMAPFRHIRRGTGLAAVMKSELITAVAKTDANVYLSPPSGAPSGAGQTWFWKEDASASGRKYWHRQIDTEATLKVFEERFSSGFAFISPAQICEMYLLPKRVNSSDTLVPATWPQQMATLMQTTGNSMGKFWADHAITAENLKERPYANIYPRVTTRSNTFQVHMRVQSLRKARSTDANTFVPGVDQVTSEYRGSAVIERYLDLNDPAFDASAKLDYVTSPLSKEPLDHLHRFRVIAQKRFDP